jgi:hypothetical protein
MTPPSSDLDERVRQVQSRTVRYWFDDGLVELFVAGSFLLIALYIAAMELAPKAVGGMLGGLFPAVYIVIWLAGRRLVRRAKEGVVYPRTGYVSYARPSPGRRSVAPIVAAVVAMLLVVLIQRAPPLLAWIPAMNGLFIAALLLLLNRSVRLPRLSFLAGVAALTGLVLAIRGGPTGAGVAVLFAIVGLVMAAGGALALRRYLRHAPPPEGA